MADQRKRGRPTKYNARVANIIIKGVMNGLTQRDAASAAGINENTLGRWKLEKLDFAERLESAKAQRTRGWLGALTRQAMEGNVRAIEALLDRCAGPEYQKKPSQVEISGTGGGPIRSHVELTDRHIEIAERIAARRGVPVDQVLEEAQKIVAANA